MKKSKTPQAARRVALAAALLLAAILPAAAKPVEIVALGDSLTAGYGVLPGKSFPEQLDGSTQGEGA